MAVLVEAISVIVRRSAIDAQYSGGWSKFVAAVPNLTLCADDDLAGVGFMTPMDTGSFVSHLERNGLCFLANERCADIAVVDQLRGPTMPADWLEYAQLPFGQTGQNVAACWLFEGPRMGSGIHLPGEKLVLATPHGWKYENSLSARSTFVASQDVSDRLKFLRHQAGTDVFRDITTGKEVFVARSKV